MTLNDFEARGQAVAALIADFKGGRMPPALLIAGESGIGKRTLARLLSQGLLCREPGDKPCGVCRACRKAAERKHPDLLFPVQPAKEKSIKIDALREMLDALSRHAFSGGRRVALIEDAHLMTPGAQNCILKSLEEAREDNFFILTSDQESVILPTVRSRCRILRMGPMTDAQLLAALSKLRVPDERARELLLSCEGSLGRALALQEDAGFWAARDLCKNTFLSIHGPTDVPRAAKALKDQKENSGMLLDILELEIRALTRNSLGLSGLNDSLLPSHWQSAPLSALTNILDALMEARRQSAANVNWQSTAERLLQIISEETSQWQR